jgi:hypothetical protein
MDAQTINLIVKVEVFVRGSEEWCKHNRCDVMTYRDRFMYPSITVTVPPNTDIMELIKDEILKDPDVDEILDDIKIIGIAWSNVAAPQNTCYGCLHDKPGQREHMARGGCQYVSDDE